jgi:hypothetical protein
LFQSPFAAQFKMNTQARRNKFSRCGQIMAALLASVFLISKTPAQPVVQPVENRFLLIFDTSSDMKKRLPAVQRALNTMLASGMRGQLHAGDSIGVWTFGRELSAKHLMQPWVPERAATIASNIAQFVAKQHYSKRTSFDALRPSLNRVVQNSDRLTVLIFCDGDSQITGTPFDSGINRIFQQQQAERKKTRQPFVLVLRSQLGNYTGCTMNLPPALVNFPEFPPFPQAPIEPTNAPSPPPPPPPVEAPPLIIIGTKAGTNSPPPEPAPVPPLTTNQPPPTVAVPPTHAIANVETNLPAPVVTMMPTNGPVPSPANLVAPVMAVSTNTMAPPPENSGFSGKRALVIGAAFLVLASVLTAWMWGRSRKTDHGSLITRSMNKGGKPPART